MAPSFFSKKQNPEKKAVQTEPGASVVVRTMQDDLDDIKSGRQDREPVQEEQQKPAFGPVSSGVSNPFSKEAQDHPFGIAPTNIQRPMSNVLPRSVLDNGLTSMVPEGGLIINEPQKSRKWLIISIILAIVTLFLLGGGWYFFSDNVRGLFKTESVLPEITEKTEEVPEITAPKSLPFSLDTPNYLSIDTEVVSVGDIQKIFSQAADRIKEAEIASPVEFFVTDQNNNPLAFNRFAFLLKFDLDADLLALIGETFSLYAYDDAGSVRFGLLLNVTDPQKAAAAITKEEAGLPYALRTLITEPEVSVSSTSTFQSSSYNQFPVRFTNIDDTRKISFDYVLDGQRWFIGMSKDTLRAILDMSMKQADSIIRPSENKAQ